MINHLIINYLYKKIYNKNYNFQRYFNNHFNPIKYFLIIKKIIINNYLKILLYKIKNKTKKYNNKIIINYKNKNYNDWLGIIFYISGNVCIM